MLVVVVDSNFEGNVYNYILWWWWWWWVDIAVADFVTISIFLTQNIGDIDIDIDILYRSAL